MLQMQFCQTSCDIINQPSTVKKPLHSALTCDNVEVSVLDLVLRVLAVLEGKVALLGLAQPLHLLVLLREADVGVGVQGAHVATEGGHRHRAAVAAFQVCNAYT